MRQNCKTLRWIRADPIKVFGLLKKGQNVTPTPSTDLKTGQGYSNDLVQTNQMRCATQLNFLVDFWDRSCSDVQHKVHSV